MIEEEKRMTPSICAVIKVNMKHSCMRYVNINDPNEVMYRFVLEHFYRNERVGSIESIDIISNPKLKAAFEKKQTEFERRTIPYLPTFVYHGTNVSSIDYIFESNFDITKSKRHDHGLGEYFQVYPAAALKDSNDQKTLIVCQILPGRKYIGPSTTWPEYDSKLVYVDENDFSQMVIIGDNEQILPCAVIHLVHSDER